MKKLFISLCLILLLVSCAKDETCNVVPENALSIPSIVNASFESQTRTELIWESGSPKSYWSIGDKIAIYNNVDKKSYAYQLSEDFTSPTRNGVFNLDPNSGVWSASDDVDYEKLIAFYPYYPYDDAMRLYIDSYDDNQLCFSSGIYYIQKFAGNNTYGMNVNPMLAIAETESTNLEFKNLFGYLKITLSGNYTVKIIVLSGNDEESLAGEFIIKLDDPYNAIIDSYGEKFITLDCEDGVQISNEGVSFIFVVPPVTFNQGFTVTAIDTDGNIYQKSTSNKIEITRNIIKSMPALSNTDLQYDILPTVTYTSTEELQIKEDLLNSCYVTYHTYDGDNSNGCIKLMDKCIKYGIFSGSTIGSIAIPNGITKIDDRAFSSCTNLTSVSIPESVTSIGQCAFEKCVTLTDINIPDGIDYLYSTFSGCTSLESITLPKGLGSKDTYFAFSGCTNLKNVTIPVEVTTIGTGMFKGCTSLENIILHDKITTIYKDAFNGSGLRSIILPSSVNKVYNYSFGGCTNLESITFMSPTPPEILDYSNKKKIELFKISEYDTNPPHYPKIYVHADAVETYKEQWEIYKDYIYPIEPNN